MKWYLRNCHPRDVPKFIGWSHEYMIIYHHQFYPWFARNDSRFYDSLNKQAQNHVLSNDFSPLITPLDKQNNGTLSEKSVPKQIYCLARQKGISRPRSNDHSVSLIKHVSKTNRLYAYYKSFYLSKKTALINSSLFALVWDVTISCFILTCVFVKAIFIT